MIIFTIVIFTCVFIFAFLIFFATRLARKCAKKEVKLVKQAFIYLYGEDKDELRKKLDRLDYIIEDMATSETEVSVNFDIVQQARDLLKEALEE